MTPAPRTTPPDGSRGFRVHRVPNKPVRRDEDGRYTIPLGLTYDGKFDGDVPLRLSPSEAESLHAQLCYALGDEPPTAPPEDHTPDCRKPSVGSRGVHWP
jgi:hypothetical protein